MHGLMNVNCTAVLYFCAKMYLSNVMCNLISIHLLWPAIPSTQD